MESIAVFKVQQIRMLDSKPIEDTYVYEKDITIHDREVRKEVLKPR